MGYKRLSVSYEEMWENKRKPHTDKTYKPFAKLLSIVFHIPKKCVCLKLLHL